MSEVYKFKAMSQVETLEEPTDATTVLVVENGTVKQIPAVAVGGNGGYMVRATLAIDYSITADKLYTEIVAAVKAGCAPVLYLATPDASEFYLIPLVGSNDEALVFQLYFDGSAMSVSCTVDNEWALAMPDG